MAGAPPRPQHPPPGQQAAARLRLLAPQLRVVGLQQPRALDGGVQPLLRASSRHRQQQSGMHAGRAGWLGMLARLLQRAGEQRQQSDRSTSPAAP